MGFWALFLFFFAIRSLDPEVFDKIENPNAGQLSRTLTTKQKIQTFATISLIFIGWGIIYYNALYGTLWFLSENWGGRNEYGEWASMRSRLSGTGGVLLTFITIFYAQKGQKIYRRLKRLEKKNESNTNIF